MELCLHSLCPPACLPVQCPQLKAVQVMGAGVDSQLEDESLPRELPLLRVIDPLMAERMATWIQWGVINTQVGRALGGAGAAAGLA